MSDFKVPVTKILEILPHPNADRLAIARVYGFLVVTQKDLYKVGDTVIYVPVDSILGPWIEEKVFPKDSKVKLHNSRVRQIRLRGYASQGLLVNPETVEGLFVGQSIDNLMEQDISSILDITKYEPPAPSFDHGPKKDKQRNRSYENPFLHKYNGLDSIKWLPDMFKEGDEVIIEEKIHGCCSRIGMLPYAPTNLWKKILKFLKLAPEYEICYGSNHAQKSASSNSKHFYGEDVWGAVFKKINAASKLKPNETVFGEIVGFGIQANYDYGLKEHAFVLFDVKILQPDGKQKCLNPEEVEQYAKERGFEFVPVLYRGPFNKEEAYKLTFGNSEYGDKSQKVREGIVIKDRYNYDNEGNKKALKWVSEVYLDDKTNTDFH